MHSTLANVGSPLRRPARRGFTMLEVLLALAIIALLASVLVGGSASLLAGSKAVTPAEVFWKTVQECRKSALKSGTDVRLVFDPKEKKFIASDASGRDSGTREYSIPASSDDLAFTFLSTQKGASMMLIGGVAVETQTLPAVTFYSDGTCTPFRAQIYRRGEATVLSIDPWTCAAVLKPDDPNAPSL